MNLPHSRPGVAIHKGTLIVAGGLTGIFGYNMLSRPTASVGIFKPFGGAGQGGDGEWTFIQSMVTPMSLGALMETPEGFLAYGEFFGFLLALRLMED